jgi:hypothetical protein
MSEDVHMNNLQCLLSHVNQQTFNTRNKNSILVGYDKGAKLDCICCTVSILTSALHPVIENHDQGSITLCFFVEAFYYDLLVSISLERQCNGQYKIH